MVLFLAVNVTYEIVYLYHDYTLFLAPIQAYSEERPLHSSGDADLLNKLLEIPDRHEGALVLAGFIVDILENKKHVSTQMGDHQ